MSKAPESNFASVVSSGALLSSMIFFVDTITSAWISGRDVAGLLDVFYSFCQLFAGHWRQSTYSCVASSTSEPHLPSYSFGSQMDLEFTHIHQAFRAHAESFPCDLAVVDHNGNSITYRELLHRSSLLASFLRTHGVRPGKTVCLVVQRSIPQVIAILGVLRAGGAYIPLDGGHVTDRALKSIISDVNPSYTLISQACISRGDMFQEVPFGCLEDILAQLTNPMFSEPCTVEDLTRATDTAYMIYTSGTTGEPKGVVVSHLNVVNLLSTSPGNLHIQRGTKVAQILNIAFDMCVWETLGCLMNGGTLYLRGPRRADWIAVMKAVDVVISTPSILAPHDPRDYPNLKVVATAGEPCPQSLADNWAQRVIFYNGCGPTEVTIVNTMQRHTPGVPISIGQPTPNNNVYILDENLKPVPLGASGIMWGGGLGISQGYLRRPELTERKFIRDPFQQTTRWMYNTGDIGRWRRDGQIEHLGRIDDQVKVKGFRVELDGVSSAMRTCSGVTNACALLIGDELFGFYAPQDVASSEVQRAVSLILPYYAVPTRYVTVSALPLTSNGKVDKAKLKRYHSRHDV